MGASPPLYDVTDLHALADGELEEVDAAKLRRALSPPDAARVAQWRRQNEVLRAAFAKIAYEPVPLSLSLLPPVRPSLRAVPAPPPPPALPRTRRWGAAVGFGGGLVAAIAAVFLMSEILDESAPGRPGSDVPGRGGLLAARTLTALGEAAPPTSRCGACGDDTLRLPNLATAGLALQSTEMTEGAAGWSACGIYADRFGTRLALCAMPGSPGGDPTPREAAPHAVTWHESGGVYALAGALPSGQLAAIGARVHRAIAVR